MVRSEIEIYERGFLKPLFLRYVSLLLIVTNYQCYARDDQQVINYIQIEEIEFANN